MFKPLLAAGLTVVPSLPGHVFIELRDQDNTVIALACLPVEHVDLLIGQIELARGHIEAGTERPSGAIH